MRTCDCGADVEDQTAGIHYPGCTSTDGPVDDPSDHYGLEGPMAVSKMPKPKPAVLTPEQQARAIDQRNKEARKGLRGVARLNAKTVAEAEARIAGRFGLASLTPPKPGKTVLDPDA